MSDEIKWQSPSMEGKWRDGKGILNLRHIEYYGKDWIDLRIMNVNNNPPNYTRHGVRITLEQAEELLPVIRQMIADMKDKREKDEREDGKHNTR